MTVFFFPALEADISELMSRNGKEQRRQEGKPWPQSQWALVPPAPLLGPGLLGLPLLVQAHPVPEHLEQDRACAHWGLPVCWWVEVDLVLLLYSHVRYGCGGFWPSGVHGVVALP